MSDPEDRATDAEGTEDTGAAEEATAGWPGAGVRPDEPPAEESGGTKKPDGATGH